MNDWVIVSELHGDVLAFKELLQMLPIVHLLVQLEAVVILIHLDVCGVVSKYIEGSATMINAYLERISA
jgi:hypothetical protein